MRNVKLNTIWQEFTEQVANVELLHYSTGRTTKAELIQLERTKENLGIREISLAAHSMSFSDVDGNRHEYDFKDLKYDQVRENIQKSRNSQYQWQLSAVYEAFEDYIENIYAYCGWLDLNFWPLEDYGNCTLPDLKTKQFEWFQDKARSKKKGTFGKLAIFRQRIPSIRTRELRNAQNFDLQLTTVLIEHFRHISVHNGGRFQSIEDFKTRIRSRLGVPKESSTANELSSLLNHFVGRDIFENTLLLLEQFSERSTVHEIYKSRFGFLKNLLLAHAFLIRMNVESHLRKT